MSHHQPRRRWCRWIPDRLRPNTPYFVGPGFATEVEAYYDSGNALQQQAEIATAAFDWVKRWIANECGGNPRSCKATVVFDVDETLLSNYEFYKGTDFTFDQEGWNAFNESCRSTPIVPVRRLYTRLRTAGIRVVIMTGRAETTRAWTQTCLEQHGITGWDRLILRAPGETGLSADAYKSGERHVFRKPERRLPSPECHVPHPLTTHFAQVLRSMRPDHSRQALRFR